jgi:glycosyltransferase involved in cell wall biosynthesis
MRQFPKDIKVGIDARMIKHSGIGVRLYHILNELSKIDNKPEIFLFGNPSILAEYKSLANFQVIPYHAAIYSIKELFGHPDMKFMDLLDIPHFNFPINYINKCIVTIHDLTPYVMREFFPSRVKRVYLQLIFRLLRFTKRIITVSEYTAQDLEKFFSYPFENSTVIYNAVDHEIFNPKKSSEIFNFKLKYKLPENYFLCVGIGKGHKNFNFIIQSLRDKLLMNEIQTPLVIAGTGGYLPDYIANLTVGIEKFIICLPKIDYSELPLLYAGAKCLLYPSLYEGFGLPLLEAQASNCPVISSNASVMPEILKESALYFDPRKSNELIDSILNLEIKSIDLINKGRKNAERFNWNQSTLKLLNVYQESIND